MTDKTDRVGKIKPTKDLLVIADSQFFKLRVPLNKALLIPERDQLVVLKSSGMDHFEKSQKLCISTKTWHSKSSVLGTINGQ